MTDHLVALFKSDHNSEQTTSSSSSKSFDLSEHERGHVSYIAGYILAKLQKQCSSKPNDELQTLLQNMKCPGIENTYIDVRSWGGGGLATPCKDVVEIVEIVDVIFRQFVTNQKDLLTKIPGDTLCNDVLKSPLLKSLWENILQGCDQDLSKQTTKLSLESIIKLYLKVCCFSYAKDYISKFKISKRLQRAKDRRKNLKGRMSQTEIHFIKTLKSFIDILYKIGLKDCFQVSE